MNNITDFCKDNISDLQRVISDIESNNNVSLALLQYNVLAMVHSLNVGLKRKIDFIIKSPRYCEFYNTIELIRQYINSLAKYEKLIREQLSAYESFEQHRGLSTFSDLESPFCIQELEEDEAKALYSEPGANNGNDVFHDFKETFVDKPRRIRETDEYLINFYSLEHPSFSWSIFDNSPVYQTMKEMLHYLLPLYKYAENIESELFNDDIRIICFKKELELYYWNHIDDIRKELKRTAQQFKKQRSDPFSPEIWAMVLEKEEKELKKVEQKIAIDQDYFSATYTKEIESSRLAVGTLLSNYVDGELFDFNSLVNDFFFDIDVTDKNCHAILYLILRYNIIQCGMFPMLESQYNNWIKKNTSIDNEENEGEDEILNEESSTDDIFDVNIHKELHILCHNVDPQKAYKCFVDASQHLEVGQHFAHLMKVAIDHGVCVNEPSEKKKFEKLFALWSIKCKGADASANNFSKQFQKFPDSLQGYKSWVNGDDWDLCEKMGKHFVTGGFPYKVRPKNLLNEE